MSLKAHLSQRGLALAIVGLVTAGAANPVAAACKIAPITFDFQIHTATDMQIGVGEYCAGTFTFPSVKVTQAQVLHQPARGLVSIDQKTLVWRYRPFKDFRGKDQFVVRLHGTKGKLDSDGTILFRVVVN